MFEMILTPRMETRITPVMIHFAEMLVLPQSTLQQLIQQELSENPALEAQEDENETIPASEPLFTQVPPHRATGAGATRYDPSDEAVDPLLTVAAPRSLTDCLMRDLRASLAVEDYPLALLLVESLDDHGFLSIDIPTLSRILNVDPQRIHAVLQQLRELGPPGIATSNVQACLLAQLDHLAQAGGIPPHAHTIVAHCFDDLGHHRYQRIARQLRISLDDIELVRHFLQQHCWPYPAQLVIAAHHRKQSLLDHPDVAMTATPDGGFKAEVLYAPRRMLRMSPVYEAVALQLEQLDAAEQEHVRTYIERSRIFLSNLSQRKAVLQQVSEALIAYQDAFLRYGTRHLLPLTRTEIAAELGVHESTVSRAIAHKSVVLPDGSLLPFAEFFHTARPVQDVLCELIAHEREPLSDAQLAEQLHQRGYPIARRTVAKYRQQLQILPAALRQRSLSTT
ncbi:MAG: hypothetical protein HC837_11625 [Chloroflexaceae bacterium]|nr:hypothetical protein [Chloroflexaceae bacterium]